MEIFLQAEQGKGSVRQESNTEISHIMHGMKIIYDKCCKSVTILNTTKSAEYYKEVEKYEYGIFSRLGWTMGVYQMALLNYKRKLNLIEARIKSEVNTRKNDKKMKALKQSRIRFMILYAYVKKKINLLTN